MEYEVAPGVFKTEEEIQAIQEQYPLMQNSPNITITFKADEDKKKCRVIIHVDADRDEEIELPVCPKMYNQVSDLLDHMTMDLVSHIALGGEESFELNKVTWEKEAARIEAAGNFLPPGLYL